MPLVNIMFCKVKHVQKIKDHMFSLICGSYTDKINVHINTYMIINIHTYMDRFRERGREHNYVSGSV
jgi:hypothetical protein